MDAIKQLVEILNPTLLDVFLIVLATVTANYASGRFFTHLSEKIENTENNWDDALFNAARQPARILIWILGLSWATEVVLQDTDNVIVAMIQPLRYVAAIVLLAMFVIKFVRGVEKNLIADNQDVTTVTAIGKLLRISVIITAGLMIMQTLGVSISGILAFGGIGGIAVGFAAKDLLANFFGGAMIYLDRPFVVGDWIKSPDRQIEGTVEKIGWRLTVIRTFDQRPLYVPNATFANIAVENPSRMHNRRIYETIGVRYDDAALVKRIIDDVRQMLEEHEDIDTNRTLIVNFNSFAPSSLDFFIYTFTKTTNWVEFHSIKEKILLQVLAIIEAHGAQVAFPTSTVHIQSAQITEAESQMAETVSEKPVHR